MDDTPALRALADSDLDHEVIRIERAGSVEEAAARIGIEPAALIKTIVVRRGDDDYLFVLVPGDRGIDWPKLRRHVGASRMSMPDADEARAVTGYERGTITPFGAVRAWPVVADAAIVDHDRVAIGGGAFGVNLRLAPDELIAVLDADVADVTKPR